MKRLPYILLHISWGLPQTLLGLVCFLASIRRSHFWYRACICTMWRMPYSASLGMFVFVSDETGRYAQTRTADDLDGAARRLLVHEYGHTIQSLIVGPLYLPLFGIPSAIWCLLPALARRRAARLTSYYSFYTERLANYLGEMVCHERSMR